MTDKEYIENIDKVDTNTLFENLEYYGFDSYYRDLWYATIEELKKRIEIRPKGEWIPVSEGLPNEVDRFLVTTRYDEVMTDYFTGHHFLQGDDIIAWQPLSEPYKRGEE